MRPLARVYPGTSFNVGLNLISKKPKTGQLNQLEYFGTWKLLYVLCCTKFNRDVVFFIINL